MGSKGLCRISGSTGVLGRGGVDRVLQVAPGHEPLLLAGARLGQRDGQLRLGVGVPVKPAPPAFEPVPHAPLVAEAPRCCAMAGPKALEAASPDVDLAFELAGLEVSLVDHHPQVRRRSRLARSAEDGQARSTCLAPVERDSRAVPAAPPCRSSCCSP